MEVQSFDEALYSKISSLNLNNVKERLIVVNGWLPDEAEVGCEQYIRFLYLQAVYHKQCEIIPSSDIDEVWHAHILHTKQYIRDTKSIFGEYFHHLPQISKTSKERSEVKNAFSAKTKFLYEKTFNANMTNCRLKPKLLRWLYVGIRPTNPC